MGREIRRVPANWEHPKDTSYRDGRYQPMHERSYKIDRDEWVAGLIKWENKTHPDYKSDSDYWEWECTPPDRNYYIPYTEESATWYQSYETVSEGTPVTPPFQTEDELITYLSTHGDFWDQRSGYKPWSLESATNFVKEDGYRMTAMISNGVVKMAKDQ